MAESVTACLGLSDLVAITVEVEFAASWKPLVKSNKIAMATVRTVTSKTTVIGDRWPSASAITNVAHQFDQAADLRPCMTGRAALRILF